MILDIIQQRRAVFPVQYNSEPITNQQIQQLLESANWAPTHRRTEPWRFKVFHSLESRKQLSTFLVEAYHDTADKPSDVKARKIAEKPLVSACVIAVCMQRDPDERVPEWEEIAATAMAVQNMWLLAHSKNIGMYWSTPSLKDQLGQHISLNEGESCLGFLYLGNFEGHLPDGIRASPIEDKTTWF